MGLGGGGPVVNPAAAAALPTVAAAAAGNAAGPPAIGGTSPAVNGDCVPLIVLGVTVGAAAAAFANRRLGEPGPEPTIGPRAGIEKAELDTATEPRRKKFVIFLLKYEKIINK